MKIVIVGAGPIGCYAAYLLAKAGKEVEVYEEHEKIGLPFQCTGLLTTSINKILKVPEDMITNKINKIKVFSPNNNIELNLKKEEIVLDRTEFDKHLARIAEKAGAKIFTSHRFLNFKNNEVTIKNLKDNKLKQVKANFLIGADGPNSKVRDLINRKKIDFYVGVQATAVMKHDKNSLDTFFGNKFPGFFGWIVPTSKRSVRIGLAARKKAGLLFDKFIKKMLNGDGLCEHQGGLIPVYNPQLTIIKNNIAIVGDAATHVKSTTGGGIVPGMIGAREIVNKILKRKKTAKNISLKIHRQLILHNIARKVLDNFTDDDFDLLISLCKKKKIKNLLENMSRDYPSKFMIKMLWKEPRFLLFGRRLLKYYF